MVPKELFGDYIYCSLVVFKSLIFWGKGQFGDEPKREFKEGGGKRRLKEQRQDKYAVCPDAWERVPSRPLTAPSADEGANLWGKIHFPSPGRDFDTELLLAHTWVEDARIVALNLWVSTPTGVTYRISCISNVYGTIHKGSKITVMK